MLKPTVLVVADEVFMMPDKPLGQLARLSVPNTLKESSMVNNAINRKDPGWRSTQGLNSVKMAEKERDSLRGVHGIQNSMG